MTTKAKVKKKRVYVPRERIEMKSMFRGVWVEFKCPRCEIIHKEQMAKKPKMLLRRFCPECRRHRED